MEVEIFLSYPINLDVENKICVVVGGGRVALRKVCGLLDAKARVIVIAPELCDGFPSVRPIEELPSENFFPPARPLKATPFEPKDSAQPSTPVRPLPDDFIWLKRKYEVGCIPRGVLMIAATDDPKVNRLAAEEAAEKNMLVNVVDRSSDVGLHFENPSTIRRGDLLLTISTGGRSPAFSKFIRQRLETIIDENFARQLDTIEKMRDTVKKIILNPNDRIDFWQQIMNEKNFSPTVDSEELGVNIRNALNSYRAQPHDRTD